MNLSNSALTPANVLVNPVDNRFRDVNRRWQGVPSIEVTAKGRIFVDFFSGDGAEIGGNFLVLCVSDDKGHTFKSCVTVVEHPDPECRIYDPCLWLSPKGELWMIYNQVHGFNDCRSGVWAVICKHPDTDTLVWTTPRRIANGIMINKPTIISTGDWLFPCAIWRDECGAFPTERHGLEKEQFSNIYASSDQGKTFRLRGSADIPNRSFDEHMVVEKEDKSLWMLVRTFDGIGESFSYDEGYTWTEGKKSHIDGPCSRFHIRRLKSGRLLMVNHLNFDEKIDLSNIMQQGNVKAWKGRSHLTAMLSEDDGKTWPHTLLLDERNEAAYPDAKECEDGYIYITYDWERVRQREILLAKITEEDIICGKIKSRDGMIKHIVNKAKGQPDVS
ncbi:exo-alpha-sialidase [Blautia liquoris]|uniref:Exo-alpha-sialidase n=1 Tax=Blautia liquoris TaxID=2779518 RepID=A0A7M2RHN1_9FIRM|nr:sialidase family protein [Blautia liquoris]QOV18850.1 exo-alpha-sialidase [Blautia liquoris]